MCTIIRKDLRAVLISENHFVIKQWTNKNQAKLILRNQFSPVVQCHLLSFESLSRLPNACKQLQVSWVKKMISFLFTSAAQRELKRIA